VVTEAVGGGESRVSRKTNWSFLSSRKKTKCFANHEGEWNLFTGTCKINAIVEDNLCPKNNFALQEIHVQPAEDLECLEGSNRNPHIIM